jgi:hypothetical protein
MFTNKNAELYYCFIFVLKGLKKGYHLGICGGQFATTLATNV